MTMTRTTRFAEVTLPIWLQALGIRPIGLVDNVSAEDP